MKIVAIVTNRMKVWVWRAGPAKDGMIGAKVGVWRAGGAKDGMIGAKVRRGAACWGSWVVGIGLEVEGSHCRWRVTHKNQECGTSSSFQQTM